jgi:hypothetical protein
MTRLRTIIIALVPTALRGVQYKPVGTSALLRWNLLVYGVGGIESRSATIAVCLCHLSSQGISSDARCEITPITFLRGPTGALLIGDAETVAKKILHNVYLLA